MEREMGRSEKDAISVLKCLPDCPNVITDFVRVSRAGAF